MVEDYNEDVKIDECSLMKIDFMSKTLLTISIPDEHIPLPSYPT